MFSRRERLHREQFGSALKKGRRISSAHFMAIVPEDVRGYAVVIPKKVIRLASTRNHVKRRVLEALRALPLPQSLIVFPRSSADSVNYQDLKAELAALLSTIRK